MLFLAFEILFYFLLFISHVDYDNFVLGHGLFRFGHRQPWSPLLLVQRELVVISAPF
jgi:hypothetical protein